MKWWKKMANKITEPERSKKLDSWKTKYETAKAKYSDELSLMETWEKYYIGDRHVKKNPNYGEGDAQKKSINVRNISYELIESQVDSSIPMPKVTPVHAEDKEKAKIIEDYLKGQIKTQHLSILNDQQERTTPTQGGSFTLLEWDNTKGYHCCIGDLSVRNIHPRQIIPQPGVIDIDEMDYIFVRTPQTKEYVKRHFGKDVGDEDETDKELRNGEEAEDLVTVITAYYRNGKNGIGLYRWCGDVELEDFEDYQARHLKVCAKCGKLKEGDVCECGSKKFVDKEDEMDSITIYQETVGYDVSGNPIVESIAQTVEIPFYKPNMIPLVLRKNISRERKFLGFSDIEVIQDQQDTVKKLGSNINEKLLGAGSFFVLPEGVGVETTDEQYKIIRLANPAQKALIDVITAQADTTQDRLALETNYNWAKSALGITDAYQGKYDASATSGTAKQFSINQAAGRLESKRVMKNQAFAQLYEMMFKFALAYADQPVPINLMGQNGEVEFSHFDKADFVKYDSAGEPYWNDEFIFDIDPTSTLLTNREAMWNQADLKLQSGAFGPLGDLETNYLYWLEQERNGYPNAGEIKNEIIKRLEEQKKMQAQMKNVAQMQNMTQMEQAQMQNMQLGGEQNEMPVM